MRRIWLLALVALACVGKDEPTTPGEWQEWVSVAWFYSYTESGYSEGLDSITGQMLFRRSGRDAYVGSQTGVVGHFWGVEAGQDTLRGPNDIWPPKMMYPGQIVGDSVFSLVTTDAIWPSAGVYRERGDTLFYDWRWSDATRAFALRITYLRTN